MNTRNPSQPDTRLALPSRTATQLLIGWAAVTAGTLLIAADWLHALV